ncbi:ovochymase-1 [Spea bombifrons]|uniref:ovochymase-1 n=1 Tax=Spea bombifrons TaxID=233779 RepID=UPI002349284D|nr:ovochymase-1 [Spea bombifrons]
MDFIMRIVGGTDSDVGGQPWTVSLQLGGKHICGGSIIQRKMVVTAAHCVYPADKARLNRMTVVVGDYNQEVIDPEEQSVSVSEVVMHPKYKHDESMSYDIALLYLSEKINYGSQVQPVCLPQEGEQVEPGTLCISSGWGRLIEGGDMSNILQEVKLPIIDNITCSSILASEGLPTLHETMLCAGFPDGGKDACQGDSGGPLVCRRRTGSWFLAGCASWGLGCGRAWGRSNLNEHERGSPAIFSKVSTLLGFLRRKISPTQGCSSEGLDVGGQTGTIRYPLGTRTNYSDNSLCRWKLQVKENMMIRIDIVQMDIEYHPTCIYDYLSFSVTEKMISKVCGSVTPSPLLIPSSWVTITFFSDDLVNGLGFELHYSAVPDITAAGSGCGSFAVLTDEGKIYSANYPNLYPSMTACHWIVEAPKGKIIKLTFEDFALEFHKDCVYDHVSIYEDPEETQLLAKLCGFTLPDPVFSPSNTMLIHFNSDQENNYPGFKASFVFLPSNRGGNSPVAETTSKAVPLDVCGVAPLSAQWVLPRIVGGEEACPNCWPWQVEIVFLGVHQCGGVIISSQVVLTAAHCIESLDPVHWMVVAGKHDRLLTEPTEQKVAVGMIVLHEEFELLRYDYDIALLRLKEPLELNDFVRPVCLPSAADTLAPSSVCVVTGWGNTQEGGQLAARLQQLQVPILDNAVCNKTYYHGRITDRMFCAGFPSVNGKDSCQGDSGGPLVCSGRNKSFVLYGINSWGLGCARAQNPGVYSKVNQFLGWIEAAKRGQGSPQHPEQKKNLSLPFYLEEKTVHHACRPELVLKGSVGSIASPDFPYGYSRGLNCSWVINISSSGVIKLRLEQLSIEESPNCTTDSLSLYQENNNERKLLVKTCGFSSSPEIYTSNWPVIRVTFHTGADGSDSQRGFLIFYKIYGGQVSKPSARSLDAAINKSQKACNDVILTSDSGVISSPGYPLGYPNDLSCQWRIIAPLEHLIELELLDLKTEKEGSSCQDPLRIYEGTGRNKLLLGSFCGELQSYSLKSDGPEVTIIFTTNSNVTMSGFTLRYNFWQTQQPGSTYTLGKVAATACPVLDLLPAGSGEIRSPFYPKSYPNGMDCRWIVYSISGKRLKLQIHEFALEDSKNCTWDFLEILDGPNNVSKILVTLCGHKPALTLQSGGSFVTLHFHTDKSIVNRGFRIHYEEVTEASGQSRRSMGGVNDGGACGVTSVDPIAFGRSSGEATVIRNEKGLFRVVGGHPAASKSWPWIVSLQTKDQRHYCGGTIIDKKWILTAAHCEFSVGSDKVFVGQTDLSLGKRTEVLVKKSYVHEKYDPDLFPPKYDILLLELETPLVLDSSVAVICLSEKTDVAYTDCITAGWGSTSTTSLQIPDVLQQARVPMVSMATCKSYWGTDITDTNICAGAAGASSCMGDSGGPLICKVRNRYTLVGVVSWGSDKCEQKTPAVYTMITAYRGWMFQYTGF